MGLLLASFVRADIFWFNANKHASKKAVPIARLVTSSGRRSREVRRSNSIAVHVCGIHFICNFGGAVTMQSGLRPFVRGINKVSRAEVRTKGEEVRWNALPR
jgi:hypothetical protein